MIRFRAAACLLASVSLAGLAACNQDNAAPPQPVQPAPQQPPAPTAPPVSYACESGQSVAVSYPDSATAQLSYKGQTYALRLVQAASGARYTGSGVEWWTETRDASESATLSRLGPNQDVGVAVLERCSRPAANGQAPTGPTPLPTPAPGGVLPAANPCRGPQLKLSNDGGDAGMGNRVANIGVQNIGLQPCSLSGYPTVVLQDARGRNLTTIRPDQSPGSYFRAGQAPTPVTLQPQEKAAFELAWNVVPNEAIGEKVCPSAARVRVTAPGDTSPTSLDLAFTPCGGKLHVSPLRPASMMVPTGG